MPNERKTEHLVRNKLEQCESPTGKRQVMSKQLRVQTSDKVKQKYQNKLGEEFGAVFHGLWNDRAWAWIRLQEYRELFGNTEHVELLNALTGGAFLRDIQHILWDDLMLRVTRLTDPLGSGGKSNLTVRRLCKFCKDEDAELHEEVSKGVKHAVRAAEFARDRRNRRISHRDLTLAIKSDAKPLDRASLRQVETALDEVHAVLRAISLHLLKEDIGKDVVTSPGARAFICYTQQLVEAVKYIDSIIDPGGKVPITDRGVAGDFLRKLGFKLTWEQMSQIMELREAARKFR